MRDPELGGSRYVFSGGYYLDEVANENRCDVLYTGRPRYFRVNENEALDGGGCGVPEA